MNCVCDCHTHIKQERKQYKGECSACGCSAKQVDYVDYKPLVDGYLKEIDRLKELLADWQHCPRCDVSHEIPADCPEHPDHDPSPVERWEVTSKTGVCK